MKRFASGKWPITLLCLAALLLAIGAAAPGLANEAAAPAAAGPTAAEVQKNLDFVWTLVAAFLVFFMQAGFAMVESGFTRAKNAVNIMMKNLMDFSVGSIAFLVIGFGIMFGTSPTGWFGTDGFLLSDFAKDADKWLYAFWMFQVVFAATAATIVSGAMAERTKFSAYLVYSAVVSALIYPVFGSWAWGSLYHGGGWLEKLGFIDFAGSTVVHSVGGWAALWGAIMLGPRKGRYTKEGKVVAIPGHSIPMAALGVFILWFGWFGFNPGSTTAGIPDIARIAVNTNLAAAAGAFASLITAWIIFKKPDAGMTLNGTLAGLVAITSPCASVTPVSSVLIGVIAGFVVVFSVLFFDRIRVDDPVGAISVHGVCGAVGTLCAAVFNEGGFTMSQLGVQALGVAAAFVWVSVTAGFLFFLLKKTVGLRVSEEEEMDGLDYHEHGNTAYANFQLVEKR
ncbi:MAG: ammonium transporter [Candidatus Deferrimicrobiaceae bacterium]